MSLTTEISSMHKKYSEIACHVKTYVHTVQDNFDYNILQP